MSGKALKAVAIGAAVIGLAVATGGISLAPTIASAGAATAAGTIGAFTVAGGLTTTFLGGLALSFGASQILSGVAGALAKTPKASQAQLSALNVSLDPSAPRKWAFGYGILSPDVRYSEPSGPDQEFIDYIICCAAHPIERFEQIWFEDELVWTGTGGIPGKYAGYLWIDTRTEGTAANTVAINGGAKWGATRRLTGCAYLHIRVKRTGNTKKADSPLAGGLPSRVTIVGKKGPVYDPRYDSTAGGAGPQRADDQSTWAFHYDGGSQGYNPALQILTYLLGYRINGKVSVGRGLPPARIDMASFITAANLCEEGVLKADGSTAPRYWSHGIASEQDDPLAVFSALLAACNGRLRDNGGRLSLAIMHNDLGLAETDPGLNDDDVLSGFTWNPDPSLEQSFNVVRGRCTDPSAASLYQPVDYPEVSLPSLDGIDRVLPLDLLCVQDPAQAQRIAKQVLQRHQYDRNFTATFGANAWRYSVGDVVPFTFSALGFVRRLFRIEQQTIHIGGTCEMVLTEENAAIYAWDNDESASVQAAEPIRYDARNSPLILGIEEAGKTALWTQVADDGGKPEDFATEGATIGLDVKNPDGTLFVPPVFDPTYINETLATIQTQVGDASTLIAGIQAKTRDGAPNLVPNADFRNGLAGWNQVGSGWAASSDNVHGTFVQNIGGAADAYLYRDIGVEAGVSYSLSAEIQADVPGDANAFLGWLDASNQFIDYGAGIIASDWSRVASTLAAPTGAVKARILLHRIAANGVIRFARVQLQRGAATGWNSAASDIETATRVTTETIERQGESAAFASRATILEATVYGTGPGTISATIGQVAQTAADETAAVGQLVTNITARIRKGSPNLLAEGDFPNGLGGWTVIGSGWSVATGYSIGPFAQNGGTAGAYLYRDVPVQALTSYSLSAEMDPDALGAIEVYADWHNGAGVAIGSAGSIQGDGWARVSTTPAVAPAGTAFARVYVRSNTNGVFGRATRIQFQEGQPTDFDPSPSVAYSYALVAEERSARVTALGAIATRAETLEAQMAGAADSVLKTTIQNNATAAADATAAVGQTTNALTARLRQGAPNLLTRGDFRGGLDGWSTSGPGWEVVTAFSVGPFLQKAGAAAGDYAYRDAPVVAGAAYSISAEMDPEPAGSAVVYIQWFGAGGYISPTSAMTNSGWTRSSAGPFVAPAGATTARVVVQAIAPGTIRATRIQLQEGAATDWRDDADAIDMFARSVIQQGVLADLTGRLQSYIRLQAIAGTSDALLSISAEDGGDAPFSRILLRADQIVLDGDALITGTVSYGAMNVSDFRSKVVDSDAGTYSNTTPGTDMAIAGINATLPNVKPDGELTFRVTGTVTLSSAGGGSNPAWDSILVIRAADAFGGALEYQVPLLQTTAPQFIIQRGDFDSLLTGACTITAFIRHGNTNIVDGDPGIPDIKSVHITASNIAVDARWHW